MKKILLTGVVLILLIILAVDFYMDHNRANNQKAQQATTIPANTAATAAVATDNNEPAQYAENATTQTTSVTHKRTPRRVKKTPPIDASLPVAATTPYMANQNWDEGNQIPVIQAESPKEYTGNIPVRVVAPKAIVVIVDRRRVVHFGLEAGVMQNSFYNNSSSKMVRNGYHAGVIADIRLGEHFALQPGIRYAMKGIVTDQTTSTLFMETNIKDKISLHYVEVPANLVVKFGSSEHARLIVGAGPYLSYLVSAQDKYEIRNTPYETPSTNPASRTTAVSPNDGVVANARVEEGQNSLPIGNDNNSGTTSMRRLDWGVGGFVGVETPGGFFAKAGSQVGLINVQRAPDGAYSSKNYNFSLSIGYLMGYRK